MALLSPGVQVSVIDQSNYTPAAAGSIPYFLIATAQNKISGAGTGIAPGTLAVNANQLYLMSSQRDLLSTYGTPFFYNTTAGTPINGYELNEYGLLAAYSALGVTNQAYIQRVDIDLSALTATLNRPVGAPANGTYWLDTTNSNWGINQWNQTTAAFTNQVPSVITDYTYLETESTVPLQSYGSIGNYAVVSANPLSAGESNLTNPLYYKRGGPTTAQAPHWLQDGMSADELYNTWVLVGSNEWQTSWATIQGTTAPSSLPVGNTIVINGVTTTIGSTNTVQQLVSDINDNMNNFGVYAANIGGSLNLYADSTALGGTLSVTGATGNATVATLTFATQETAPYDLNDSILVTGLTSTGAGYNGYQIVTACSNSSVSFNSTYTGAYVSGGTIGDPGAIYIEDGVGTPLTTLGITPGDYSGPTYYHGANYQAPRWRSTDPNPAPTGSVFQQTNSVNLGCTLIVKKYNSTLGTFVTQPCPVYVNDSSAIYGLDPVNGGQSIPAGSTYAQIDPHHSTSNQQAAPGFSEFLLLERYATGPTVITGSITNPTFPSVSVSVTGASGTGSTATLTFSANTWRYPVGATIVVTGIDPTGYNGTYTVTASTSGSVSFASTTTAAYVSSGIITGGIANSFSVYATEPETSSTIGATVSLGGTTAADFINAVSAANVPNVSATINSAGAIVFTHATGGDIFLTDQVGIPVTDAGFNTDVAGVRYQNITGPGLILSNWVSAPAFNYIPQATPPEIDPVSGTYWYYSDATTADIMIQNNGEWMGYQNVTNDVRGYDLSMTNATGPIFSATAPTTQTNAALSPLQYGDLWIDTSDLELYPMINRWETVNGQDQWVAISNSDQTTINGIVFADARWAPNGTTNPVSDPIPPISGAGGLITSDYLDLDAPNPLLYPQGMLLWNTRRSGFNVKTFEYNYFNATDYPFPDVLPTQTSTWLSASGLRVDGSPNMGRQAQRAIIVKALRSGIDSNQQILESQVQFNLLACPAYPELAPDMVTVNNNRGDTGFIVVDTPLRLPSDTQSLVKWATDNNGLGVVTGDGNLAVGQAYAAAFYPSCQTTDLSGNLVVTAPSHMMIRTIIRSDAVSYPWFAPAGLRRGVVDNAITIGYLDAATGKFVPTSVTQGMRDVLYQNDINPITFIPGAGITNFGNHTLQGTATALDRINVARLVAYLRGQLEVIGNQYLFEPNDTITRSAITAQISSLMNALVSQRGVYDYLVVCDLSNNTPATIDANELFVDIAIEPTKAVEFIYIPMRIQNTGTIAAQGKA